jgi:hypothetical protein
LIYNQINKTSRRGGAGFRSRALSGGGKFAKDEPERTAAQLVVEERMSATITSTAAAPAGQRRPDVAVSRPDTERWSARRTLAFVALTCGGFWIGVVAFVSFLTRVS